MPHTELLYSFPRPPILDPSFGDLVERDRNGFVGIDRLLIDQRFAGEILPAIAGRKLLHTDPVVQLARALGHDVDETEFRVGMLEQRVQVAEYGLAHETFQ